jgi:DNA/RNA endonuclease YhcR with UshA esterase domain
MRLRLSVVFLVLLPAVVLAAEDSPRPLTPEEAARKVNEKVTVQMEVKSAALRGEVCFLNSQEDFKDEKNFTIFIGGEALKKFKEAKIDDPAAHFKGKTVRVKGQVKLYRDKPEIVVDGPDQIEVVSHKP